VYVPCRLAFPPAIFCPFRFSGDHLEAEFIERLSEVNEHLAKHGLPALSAGNATRGTQGLPRRTVEGESAMEGSEQANGHH
jgi:homogentisate 1,2-dioxygenase